jgi:hypothetical protein
VKLAKVEQVVDTDCIIWNTNFYGVRGLPVSTFCADVYYQQAKNLILSKKD